MENKPVAKYIKPGYFLIDKDTNDIYYNIEYDDLELNKKYFTNYISSINLHNLNIYNTLTECELKSKTKYYNNNKERYKFTVKKDSHDNETLYVERHSPTNFNIFYLKLPIKTEETSTPEIPEPQTVTSGGHISNKNSSHRRRTILNNKK